jgi:hypothetical protein
MCGAVAGTKGTGVGANEIARRWDVVGQVAIGVGRPSADAAARLIAGLRVLGLGSRVLRWCRMLYSASASSSCLLLHACLLCVCCRRCRSWWRGGVGGCMGQADARADCGCVWAWQARRQTEPGIL